MHQKKLYVSIRVTMTKNAQDPNWVVTLVSVSSLGIWSTHIFVTQFSINNQTTTKKKKEERNYPNKLKFANSERHQVGGHQWSGRESDHFVSGRLRLGGFVDHLHVGERGEMRRHLQGHIEHRLVGRLIPARKCHSCVSALKLME